MPRLGRRRLKVVVQAVDVDHGERRALRIRNAVETAHHDGDHRLAVRPRRASERFDPALLAEQVMDALRTELIVAECVGAALEPEIVTADADEPGPGLTANRA